MKYSLLAIAATIALATPAAAEPAKQQPQTNNTTAAASAKANANAQAQAQADAGGEKKGFFDGVKDFFAADEADAQNSAKAEPAAGETQQPKARKTSQTNANAKRRPADQTNPALGRVITEGGADIGVRTNAKLGGGAAGSYGNE